MRYTSISKYEVEQLKTYTEALFTKFAPLQIGGRVALLKDVIMTENNTGWAHCKCFLLKNAIGTVVELDYSKKHNNFIIDVVFDVESYIYNETELPVSNYHSFRFPISKLYKISKSREKAIIQLDTGIKRNIRIFRKVQKELLNKQLIKKEYETSSYNTMKKWFDSYTSLLRVITSIKLYKGRTLELSDKEIKGWKSLPLIDLVTHIK